MYVGWNSYMPTKSTTTKIAKKPRATAAKKTVEHKVTHKKVTAELDLSKTETVFEQPSVKTHTGKEKYIFATGRRKTAVANVRLFEGKGHSIVNKMPLNQYFSYSFFHDEISKPLEVTGLVGKHYFTAHVNGGGPHAQATALRHGISGALGKISEDVRKILKKNGFLTRDDRKKERKKPGLKRARRSPQWAKR